MYPIIKAALHRRLTRSIILTLALGAGMTTLLLALLTLLNPALANAGEHARANVVVQVDTTTRIARTIEFTGQISGLEALELSGIEFITHSYAFGDAVCSIAGVGCPSENCFCSSKYWGYNFWDGAQWQGYPVGPGSSVISQTGAVEGWRWGEFGDPLTPVTPSLQALSALGWLDARQTITGDFGGVAPTIESVLAIGANQQRNEHANDYLRAAGLAYSRSSAGSAGKLAVAMTGLDTCWPFGAVSPTNYFSPTLGAYSRQSGANAWTILGLAALSETIPASAVAYLADQSQPNGGWEWSPGWGADSNTTALAIQALIAAGQPITASTILSGLAYLDSTQHDDGGFPYDGGAETASDTNSTAYVIQALVAAGENPSSPRWTAPGGDAFTFLAKMQLSDGSFEWQAGSGSNLLATQQAIPALLGRPYPVLRQDLPACPGVVLPYVSRD